MKRNYRPAPEFPDFALDFANDRDATLKLIDWFAIDRVRAARVLVVGAGAIGNEALKCAALLGIGNIYIFDRDTIEMSNLSRSVLYRAADNRAFKAPTAARAVREINPNVNTHPIIGDLRFDLALGLLRRMDVVIGCLDSRLARFALNRLCQLAGKPWIDAGIGQLNGQVQAFRPDAGPCYECAFSDLDYEEIKIGCNDLASIYASEGKIPTTPTIASLVAAVQMQEALKLLDAELWRERTLVGREFTFNGTVGFAQVTGLPARHDCPAHTTMEREQIIELPEAKASQTTVGELLAAARQQMGTDAVLSLNFELAVEMRCPDCSHVEPVLMPKLKLYREQVKCLRCDHPAELVTTNKLSGKREFENGLLDLPLARLGIPALDILQARGANGATVYLELTGDATELTSQTK